MNTERCDVIDVVRLFLEQHTDRYDGLGNSECGCLAADLSPGDCMSEECYIGHRVEGCSSNCGNGCDFHVVEGPRK